MHSIVLRPLTDGDIPMMEKWLKAEHVRPWYPDYNDWLDEMINRQGAFAFLHHFIAMDGDTPFGFCQYYDGFDAGEDWYEAGEPGEVYSIDYLIGLPEYLGKGYGRAVVGAVTDRAIAEGNPRRIEVQPDAENEASRRTLLACGYAYDAERDVFIRILR